MRQCFDDRCAQVLGRLTEALGRRWPGIPVVAAGLAPTQMPTTPGPYWPCDPLDGAIQYLAGLPMWTTTLTADHQPQLAFVHDATLDRTFHAVRGRCAGSDGATVTCSDRQSLASATVGTSFPNHPRRRRRKSMASSRCSGAWCPRCWRNAGSARRTVASGRLDAYWETGRHWIEWLPGLLVAQESGAAISPFADVRFGQAGSGIIAGPAPFQRQLLDISRSLDSTREPRQSFP